VPAIARKDLCNGEVECPSGVWLMFCFFPLTIKAIMEVCDFRGEPKFRFLFGRLIDSELVLVAGRGRRSIPYVLRVEGIREQEGERGSNQSWECCYLWMLENDHTMIFLIVYY
jgi:hypothetical protein